MNPSNLNDLGFKDLSSKALVKQNRSCRRFDNSHKIDESTLRDLVDLARNCASGANKQPLKYIICRDEQKNQTIFSCLGWAAYLKDWKGPVKEERPSGYIVILGDHNISDNFFCWFKSKTDSASLRITIINILARLEKSSTFSNSFSTLS